MNQREVSEARQISSFKRVVTNNIQRRVIELQEGNVVRLLESNIIVVRDGRFVEDNSTCLDEVDREEE